MGQPRIPAASLVRSSSSSSSMPNSFRSRLASASSPFLSLLNFAKPFLLAATWIFKLSNRSLAIFSSSISLAKFFVFSRHAFAASGFCQSPFHKFRITSTSVIEGKTHSLSVYIFPFGGFERPPAARPGSSIRREATLVNPRYRGTSYLFLYNFQ